MYKMPPYTRNVVYSRRTTKLKATHWKSLSSLITEKPRCYFFMFVSHSSHFFPSERTGITKQIFYFFFYTFSMSLTQSYDERSLLVLGPSGWLNERAFLLVCSGLVYWCITNVTIVVASLFVWWTHSILPAC